MQPRYILALLVFAATGVSCAPSEIGLSRDRREGSSSEVRSSLLQDLMRVPVSEGFGVGILRRPGRWPAESLIVYDVSIRDPSASAPLFSWTTHEYGSFLISAGTLFHVEYHPVEPVFLSKGFIQATNLRTGRTVWRTEIPWSGFRSGSGGARGRTRVRLLGGGGPTSKVIVRTEEDDRTYRWLISRTSGAATPIR